MKTKLLLVILFSLACHASTVDAQKPASEQKPDVSDKALITREAPDAKKNPSPKAAEARAVKQYTIEQFMDTTRLGGSSFSADEKSILFHSNKTGIFNVYTMPAAAGGAPKQLTNSTKESTYAVSYFPADARFLYRYDKGGNENEHLYLRELDGTERDLTPGDKTKANFLVWSHDRKSFFFSTNARDARYFDIFEMSAAGLKPALIYKDETGYDFGAISNDKQFIAFEKTGGSTADSDVYLYKTATKEMKHLTPHEGDVANTPEAFDPQSKYLYFLSNEGGEFMYVARYDLKEGKREVVEKAPWDVSAIIYLTDRPFGLCCGLKLRRDALSEALAFLKRWRSRFLPSLSAGVHGCLRRLNDAPNKRGESLGGTSSLTGVTRQPFKRLFACFSFLHGYSLLRFRFLAPVIICVIVLFVNTPLVALGVEGKAEECPMNTIEYVVIRNAAIEQSHEPLLPNFLFVSRIPRLIRGIREGIFTSWSQQKISNWVLASHAHFERRRGIWSNQHKMSVNSDTASKCSASILDDNLYPKGAAFSWQLLRNAKSRNPSTLVEMSGFSSVLHRVASRLSGNLHLLELAIVETTTSESGYREDAINPKTPFSKRLLGYTLSAFGSGLVFASFQVGGGAWWHNRWINRFRVDIGTFVLIFGALVMFVGFHVLGVP